MNLNQKKLLFPLLIAFLVISYQSTSQQVKRFDKSNFSLNKIGFYDFVVMNTKIYKLIRKNLAKKDSIISEGNRIRISIKNELDLNRKLIVKQRSMLSKDSIQIANCNKTINDIIISTNIIKKRNDELLSDNIDLEKNLNIYKTKNRKNKIIYVLLGAGAAVTGLLLIK